MPRCSQVSRRPLRPADPTFEPLPAAAVGSLGVGGPHAITAGRRAKAVTGAAIAAWVFDVGCGWSTTRVALRLGISHELVRKRQMQARRLVRQQLLGPGEPEVGRADC